MEPGTPSSANRSVEGPKVTGVLLDSDVEVLYVGSSTTDPEELVPFRGIYVSPDGTSVTLRTGPDTDDYIEVFGTDVGLTINNVSNTSWPVHHLPNSDTILVVTSSGNDRIRTIGVRPDLVIRAGRGNDTIEGGYGNDLLDAGPGSDSYVFDEDSYGGIDTIEDIERSLFLDSSQDLLDFSRFPARVVLIWTRQVRSPLAGRRSCCKPISPSSMCSVATTMTR